MKTLRPFNTTMREVSLDIGTNKIILPGRAQVLEVSYFEGTQLALIVAVDRDAESVVERTFLVVPPGSRVRSNLGRLTHIGSPRMQGKEPRHVFEVESPEDGPRKGALRGVNITQDQVVGNVAPGGVSMQIGQVLGGVRRADVLRVQ